MNDEEKRTGPVEDHRSKPRWSANRKMDAVLRLLRGNRWISCPESSRSKRSGSRRGVMTSSSTAGKG